MNKIILISNIIGILLSIVGIIILIILCKKYISLKIELEDSKRKKLASANKLSMIEYTIREYEGGVNPITALRKISNIIKYTDEQK